MVVIVCGLPGSGKSYFASHLASVLHAEYINSDRLRKQLGVPGKYSLGDKLAIYDEMLNVASEFIKQRKTTVVDATFYLDSMRQMFKSEVKQWDSDICIIYVYAKESLISERLSKTRSDSEADFKVYLSIRDQFEKIKTRHLAIESTNENLTTMLNMAVSYINALR